MAGSTSEARRTALLRALLSRTISVEDAIELLSREPWDSPSALVVISEGDVRAELQRFLGGELSAESVEDWANVFEVRDDIDFQNDVVKEIVFELANSEREGSLTLIFARAMLSRVS